jgi:hypothetical protein
MSKKTTSRYSPFPVRKDVSCIFSHERAPLPHVFCNKRKSSENGRKVQAVPKNYYRWVSYNYASSKQL